MAPDPYRYFRIEARELIDEIGKVVRGLEKGTSPELVARFLRLTHTLKGAARVVRQVEIADGAHALEDALSPFRESNAAIPREQIEAFLALTDRMADRLAMLAAPSTPQSPASPTANKPTAVTAPSAKAPSEDELAKTVRAELDELDALLDGVAEVHSLLEPLRKSRDVGERAKRLADVLLSQFSSPNAPNGSRRGALNHESARSMAEELRDLLSGLEQSLSSSLDQVDRELGEVRRTTEQLRLCQVSTLFPALERTARDVALTLGKSVRFTATGGDVRLDAHVLAEIQAALVQIVRNAIAHGIERPEDRVAAGKPIEGVVTLEVVRRGSMVAFIGKDDGRGVDLDAVERAVSEKLGPKTPSVKRTREELFELLLGGGLSTSSVVTQVSGRGVGLDVVRARAQHLGGTASVRSTAGQGTTVELSVPLAVASLEGLVVETSGISVTIPLDAIRRTVRLTSDMIARTATGESIVHEGNVIPFLPLARALWDRKTVRGAEHSLASKGVSALIIRGKSGLAALGVDRMHGMANTVVRPMPALAPASFVIAGASFDAAGEPRLVLDPDALVLRATRGHSIEREAESIRPPILVIDDSLTTRMLEQSILESAGYVVDTATSGEEGLDKAQKKKYGLFLVDVEMPGIDGFTFVERTRNDAILRSTPAILVSSRSSVEDKARGAAVGAAAYVVKSEFNQVELLRRIEMLVRAV